MDLAFLRLHFLKYFVQIVHFIFGGSFFRHPLRHVFFYIVEQHPEGFEYPVRNKKDQDHFHRNGKHDDQHRRGCDRLYLAHDFIHAVVYHISPVVEGGSLKGAQITDSVLFIIEIAGSLLGTEDIIKDERVFFPSQEKGIIRMAYDIPVFIQDIADPRCLIGGVDEFTQPGIIDIADNVTALCRYQGADGIYIGQDRNFVPPLAFSTIFSVLVIV